MTNEENDRARAALRATHRVVSRARTLVAMISPGQGADLRAAVESLREAECDIANAYRRITGDDLAP